MSFLSHLHSELRQARFTRRGATHSPENVPTGIHKAYERMEKIKLPQPEELRASLADVLNKRASYSGGSAEGVISLQNWGTLLGLALKKKKDSKHRNYPSGGALYPIETYLISNAVPETTPSAFHYNPTEHSLEKLWELSHGTTVMDFARTGESQKLLFSSLIVFTSIWKRSSAKYGDLAFLHGLLEAGHMSENILLVTTALGLKTRPIAGFNDDLIANFLDLDTENEQPVHSISLSS